ncbi:MAG: hypothetical protein Q9N26_01205 [Aquificota bacterium]|nr:hypothetical protein [Aquificota bacterium]
MRKLIGVFILTALTASASDDIKISFGDGGFKYYEVVDNTCFSFVLKPKELTRTPHAVSTAMKRTLLEIKKMYRGKADAFINIRIAMTHLEGLVLYQVCGDLVKEVR